MTDLGTPPRTTRANIVQNVLRNKNDPTFNPDVTAVTIDRSQAEGDVIATLTAQDSDSSAPFNVITYAIVGDGDAARFFRVEEESGRVVLSSSVAQQDALEYTVYKL